MPLDFDGVNDSVDLRSGSNIPALNGVSACTLMGWFLLKSLSHAPLFSLSVNNGGVPSNASRAALDRSALPGALEAVARAPDGGAPQFGNDNAVGAIPVGVYIHLAVVIDYANAVLRTYRDGVLTATVAATLAPAADATDSASGAFYAEDTATVDFSPGELEDARLYNRALSSDEIATIHACRGTDGITTGLVHRWMLDEGAEGVAAAGAGSIKDAGPAQRNVNPVDAPVYRGSVIRSRRKVG